MEQSSALLALAALGHVNRLTIFRLLVQAGPQGLSAGRIAEQAGLAPSSLSFHVKELTRAGLVNQRQESRFIFYAANYGAMNGLVAFLTENCCGSNPCSPVAACSPATLEKTR